MRASIATLVFLLLGLSPVVGIGAAGAAEASGEEPPGAIRFEARNLMMRAKGQFHRWRIARATIDEANPGDSVVEVVVDLASVDTGIEKRDVHLRTPDFFDVETHPEATVVLERFRREDPEQPQQWTADVTLDLHGVTRSFPMVFTVVDPATGLVNGRTTLKRTDYGVGGAVRRWNPTSVRDEVEIEVEATIPPPGLSRDGSAAAD